MSGLFMKYFVLKPAGDDVYAKASRKAMRAYAWMLKSETEDTEINAFADELLAWATREFDAMLARTATGGDDD